MGEEINSNEAICEVLKQPTADEGFDTNVIFVVIRFHHLRASVQFCDPVAGGCRNAEGHGMLRVGDQFCHVGDECFQTFAGVNGNKMCVWELRAQSIENCGIGDFVDFVEDLQGPLFFGTEFSQHIEGGLTELENCGLGCVEDMDEEVRKDGLFKGCAERFYEAVRESTHEADGIREQEWLPVRERNLAGCGVEGCEQFVFDEDLRSREAAQERGFTRIGVSHDGCVGDGSAFAVLALGGAGGSNGLQFPLQAIDVVANPSFVLLELGFPFALGPDAAALPNEVSPGTGESGEGILEAGQFDLESSFVGPSSLGEDIEDDFLTVEDRYATELFPVPLLAGGEFVIEDDAIEPFSLYAIGNLLGFTGAEQVARMALAVVNQDAIDHWNSERIDEIFEFEEKALRVVSFCWVGERPDEKGFFHHLPAWIDINHARGEGTRNPLEASELFLWGFVGEELLQICVAFLLEVFHRDELQRGGVDAVAQAGRFWAIGKHMAEVSVALL